MAGRPQPDPDRRLLLSRDARLAALAKIDPEKHPRAAGLTARGWQRVRQICEAIELATTREGCVLAVAALAAKSRMSRRNFLRSAALGRDAGVLGSRAQYDDRGRAWSQWWVAWDRLSAWAGVVPADLAAQPPDGRRPADDVSLASAGLPPPTEPTVSAPTLSELAPTLSDLAPTALDLAPTLSDLALTSRARLETPPGSYFIKPKQQPSSLPPDWNTPTEALSELARIAGGEAAGDDGWRRLEDVLFACGVDRAERAVRAARQQGCTVAHCAALVAEWQAHGGGTAAAAWGPAALAWRFTTARPQLPPDRGWPRVSGAWLAHQARQRAARAAAETAARRRADAATERFEGSMVAELRRLRGSV